jgi:hypothetical protein
MNPRYPTVARRAGRRCEYRRAPEEVFNFPCEVEHVFPVSRGGADDESNLCLACRACNARKGERVSFRDEETQEVTTLFDPRRQRWAEHFTVDPDSGEIIGATPTGRATVACLDLNHPLQLAARAIWIRFRLFP